MKLNIPYRTVTVKNWGDFRVPRHIVRIDIDDPGKAGTHGWQVRYPHGHRSTFFSDGKANPKTRLREAITYLASIWHGPTSRLHAQERRKKKIKTGVVGVHLAWERRSKRSVRELFVIVNPTKRNGTPKGFYVGTERTATQERLDAVFAKAQRYRTKLVAAYQRELRCS